MKRMGMILVLSMAPLSIAGYDFVISEGDFVGLTLDDHQTLLMTGGGGDSLSLTEWSSAVIFNTSPYSEYPRGGIRELRLADYSRLDIYGGDILDMNLGAYSTATLYGGKFQEIRSTQSAWKNEGQPPVLVPNPHIEMVVRDWLYNAANKRLTGTWGDFSVFNIQLVDVQGYSPTIENIQFTIIPEPITLGIMGLGFLLLKRKRI